MKLCICFGICLSSKWFHLRLTFFPFLKPWADNSSANQYSYHLLYGRGMIHLVPSYLKNAYCGRGASETPSALRCLFYLINSFLTGITWLKTSRGSLFLPPSDVCVRSFLCLFYTLINLYHTKALSNRAPSLAPGWIPLLQRPRILVSFTAEQQPFTRKNWRQEEKGMTEVEMVGWHHPLNGHEFA